LDVGSGKFKRYDFFFKYDKYITLDINPKHKPDIVASADNIPLKDGLMDSIICTQVLGDIKNPSVVLKEFFRILKSGGVVLLSESLLNELHDEPNDFWRFTKFGFRYLFEKNGFEIIKVKQIGGFFSSQAQLRIRYFIDRFDLYNKKWSFIIRLPIRFYGEFMLFLDRIDKSKANQKHAICWCVLAKKQ